MIQPDKHDLLVKRQLQFSNGNQACILFLYSHVFYHFDEAKSTQSHVVARVDHHHCPTRLYIQFSQIKAEKLKIYDKK